MAIPSRKRLARLGIGALLALLIQIVCAVPSARAALCGRHVETRTSHSLALTQLDPLLLGDSELMELVKADDAPLSNPKRRLPCSGPRCSGNVPLPVAPVILTLDRLDHWGTLANLFELAPAAPRSLLTPADSPRPIILPFGIFHPPRRSERDSAGF